MIAVTDMCRGEAEDACQRATLLSGQEVDWHYFSGRVVFKCLGDTQKAANVLYPMIGADE